MPHDGAMCDLMWSDPLEDEVAPDKEFLDNEKRACSVRYGLKPVKNLLDTNDLAILIRAH